MDNTMVTALCMVRLKLGVIRVADTGGARALLQQ